MLRQLVLHHRVVQVVIINRVNVYFQKKVIILISFSIFLIIKYFNLVRNMMYGFGDDPQPYAESVELLEDLVVQYITDMVKIIFKKKRRI